MPHFAIKCRFTGAVRFEGEFGSLRLCAEAGLRARAYLSGAYLSGAKVRETKLGKRGVMKEATRSDGYRFMLFDCEGGTHRVMAGCRWFTLPEARQHWTRTRDNTPLGEETFDILVMFEHHVERIAKEGAP